MRSRGLFLVKIDEDAVIIRVLSEALGNTGIGLGVHIGRDDFFTEDAARRIDLVNGEFYAITKVGACGHAAAR